MMNKTWSLYNRVEKLRIDDLRPDQVRTILLSVPAKRMSEWYACQVDDSQWRMISEIPEFYDEARFTKTDIDLPEVTNPKAQKPKEARRPLFEDAPSGLAADPTLQMEAAQIKERRSARRYVRDLSFRLDGNAFHSATADISMGGLSIKDDLPGGLPKSFRAEIELNGAKILIVCAKVSARKMRILEADKWELLRQWLVNW